MLGLQSLYSVPNLGKGKSSARCSEVSASASTFGLAMRRRDLDPTRTKQSPHARQVSGFDGLSNNWGLGCAGQPRLRSRELPGSGVDQEQPPSSGVPIRLSDQSNPPQIKRPSLLCTVSRQALSIWLLVSELTPYHDGENKREANCPPSVLELKNATMVLSSLVQSGRSKESDSHIPKMGVEGTHARVRRRP
ncbi:hypothetical protein BJX76DRAFT_152910 [Aspergillus varians]